MFAHKPLLNVHVDVSSGARSLNLVFVFIYNQTVGMVAAKALASLYICADSHEPLLLEHAISTQISRDGPSINIYTVVALYET